MKPEARRSRRGRQQLHTELRSPFRLRGGDGSTQLRHMGHTRCARSQNFRVTFRLVSTCRPGARIAGTNHISEHAHGRAVDLMVPKGISKREVVHWFLRYHKLARGGCGERRSMRTRLAHAQH